MFGLKKLRNRKLLKITIFDLKKKLRKLKCWLKNNHFKAKFGFKITISLKIPPIFSPAAGFQNYKKITIFGLKKKLQNPKFI